MTTENTALMSQTKNVLKGKWGLAIGTLVIYVVIIGAIGSIPKVGSLFSLLIGGPLSLGLAIFFLSLARNKDAKIGQIFEGFNNFVTALCAYLLMLLFILLWTLLLIVPGIIAGLSYSMTFYILADNPSIAARDAIRNSKAMMNGYKLKLFYLSLRFFGLGLLCILTLGIGFLWLLPYVQVCLAKFYDDIKVPTNNVAT
ncbi:MAG: DUF975 family protein [Fibrobacterota bacterium]|nr:DUF975 family protein [Chitinispirillaceae bacterium]